MNLRELTLKLLDDYEISGKYVNLSLSAHAVRSLDEKERARLTVLLYTTVEHKITLDYYIAAVANRDISSIDIHTRNILRLGICQILYVDAIPDFAAVAETVKLCRHKGERSFVNGVLRELVRRKEGAELPMPKREKNVARYLSVAYSFPLWMVKRLLDLLGEEECEAFLKASSDPRGIDLTVNTLKISRDELISLFRENGIEAVPSLRTEISVRVPTSRDPRSLPGFEDGLFFVQDEICAVCAEALEPARVGRIIDVCSAPGGKAFSAAILSGDVADVTACDIHISKLSLIEDGAARLALSKVKAELMDATNPREEYFGSFDRVICDVPCSGLGVMGKKPDLRYKDAQSVSALPKLQYEILESSAKYLASDGILVYSTCTVLPEENEMIVEKFFSEHPDFAYCDFEASDLASSSGMLTTYPHRHGTDGFFIAKLKRVKN